MRIVQFRSPGLYPLLLSCIFVLLFVFVLFCVLVVLEFELRASHLLCRHLSLFCVGYFGNGVLLFAWSSLELQFF
jgi:hypothetical protein